MVYTSFTGKACTVLKEKGNKNIQTLCKLLYDYKVLKNGKFIKTPKSTLEYKIVVVDEISMVPMSLIKQLATYNVYVICLGDPFQLPPINKNEDNHLLDNPHVFLDEIMRQEKESEIIRYSMDIRAGRPINFYKGNEIQILNKNTLNDGMLKWADQVLVAKNDTRFKLNQYMRKLYGFEGEPKDGDKVIFLRNYWDILSEKNESGERFPIVNGTIGYLQNIFPTGFRVPYYLGNENFVEYHVGSIITEQNEIYNNLELDSQMLTTNKPCLSDKTLYNINKTKRRSNKHYPEPMELAYAYAITCHKAQGSQFDKVLILEEKFPFGKEEHARWLYTAITRGIHKVVWLR